MNYSNQIFFSFLANVFVWFAHFILVIYFQWMWKALFLTEHQIAWTNTPLIFVHCPAGLQQGAPVSFTIYVGTGNGSSLAREHCSPCKTGRTHCSLMHAGDKKQTNQGPEAWGSRLRTMITGDFSRWPTLFCAWSRLTGLCRGNGSAPAATYTGCSTVSCLTDISIQSDKILSWNVW